MATLLGTNTYWSASTNNNNAGSTSMRPTSKQELPQMSTNGSMAPSNSSNSLLTAFNFDDSSAGNDEQTTVAAATSLALDTSPPFYPSHLQHLPAHFNNIYQQHHYQQLLSSNLGENTLVNNNGPVFKDLGGGGSKTELMPICSGCQQTITDRFILRVHPNLEFHASCLKCNDCQRTLDETCTVFLRNGRTYCKDDYTRLFAHKCQRCEQQFAVDELVMRARNSAFHLDCFTCITCNRKLSTGKQFVVYENELYCQTPECCRQIKNETWEAPTNPIKNRLSMEGDARLTPLSLKAELLDEPSALIAASSSTMQPIGYASSSNLITAPLHQSSLSSNSSTSSLSGRHSISVGTSSGGRKSKKDKPTQRVRTVLTEQQLKILKHMYTINQRPDATTKETLVQQTGLSQRVIRVWFQNKRCKDKKKQNLAIEQEHNLEKEQAIHGVRMNGVGPIVALSPTLLQDTGLMNPIEIRQFPQNPALWTNTCDTASNNNSSLLADLSYQSTVMVNNIPTSYPQELSNLSPDYSTVSNLRYGVSDTYNPAVGLNIPLANNNGLPNSSLSSSPACSD